MPETTKTENIDQKAVIEKTLYMSNYFMTQLQVILKDGEYRRKYPNHVEDKAVGAARKKLSNALEEFRYSFMSLYEMVRHKDRFSKPLNTRIMVWINTDTNRNVMPDKYYINTIKLYREFIDHLATLKVIEK